LTRSTHQHSSQHSSQQQSTQQSTAVNTAVNTDTSTPELSIDINIISSTQLQRPTRILHRAHFCFEWKDFSKILFGQKKCFIYLWVVDAFFSVPQNSSKKSAFGMKTSCEEEILLMRTERAKKLDFRGDLSKSGTKHCYFSVPSASKQ
jgi:hypothetical protein